jgi:hypothetical protein
MPILRVTSFLNEWLHAPGELFNDLVTRKRAHG